MQHVRTCLSIQYPHTYVRIYTHAFVLIYVRRKSVRMLIPVLLFDSTPCSPAEPGVAFASRSSESLVHITRPSRSSESLVHITRPSRSSGSLVTVARPSRPSESLV